MLPLLADSATVVHGLIYWILKLETANPIRLLLVRVMMVVDSYNTSVSDLLCDIIGFEFSIAPSRILEIRIPVRCIASILNDGLAGNMVGRR